MLLTAGTTTLSAYKPTHKPHQSWQAEILRQSGDWIVTHAAYGTQVQHHTKKLSYAMAYSSLGIFNLKEYYNVFIDFHGDGSFKMLYVNVATPAKFEHHTISWIDLELDIIRLPNKQAQLIDEDEFQEAQVNGTLPPGLANKAQTVATSLLPIVGVGEFPFLTHNRSITERLVIQRLEGMSSWFGSLKSVMKASDNIVTL